MGGVGWSSVRSGGSVCRCRWPASPATTSACAWTRAPRSDSGTVRARCARPRRHPLRHRRHLRRQGPLRGTARRALGDRRDEWLAHQDSQPHGGKGLRTGGIERLRRPGGRGQPAPLGTTTSTSTSSRRPIRPTADRRDARGARRSRAGGKVRYVARPTSDAVRGCRRGRAGTSARDRADECAAAAGKRRAAVVPACAHSR